MDLLQATFSNLCGFRRVSPEAVWTPWVECAPQFQALDMEQVVTVGELLQLIPDLEISDANVTSAEPEVPIHFFILDVLE